MNDQEGLAIAIDEAKISYGEGGIPVSNTRCSHIVNILRWGIGRSRLGVKKWRAVRSGPQHESSTRLSYSPCM